MKWLWEKLTALFQGVKTMFMKMKLAAGILGISLLPGGVLVDPSWAQDQPANKMPAMLSPDQFDKLWTLIKPKPGGFDDLPWMTNLWEARQKAAAEGKPILIWVGDGHPLGWT